MKVCNCDETCNTDPRTLFVCPCECHYAGCPEDREEFYEERDPAWHGPDPCAHYKRFYRR